MNFGDTMENLWESSGFANFQWQNAVMIVIACVFLYLGIRKKFEPLLLVGIAFGMLISNLPGPISGWLFHPDYWTSEEVVANGVNYAEVLNHGGLVDILYIGVKTGVYPCLIFLGVGAMTDFEPLLSNPKSLILGAAAQIGIYVAFFLAVAFGFTGEQAASIGIIGGADGPTAIWLTKGLAPELLAAIAVAAYSYMALIPIIQPPLMRLVTTKKERAIVMKPTRKVKKAEKILFPIVVTIATCLFLPSVAPLLGCLMLGNLFKECGVTERLSDTAQNALMNIVTILLGVSVGATAHYSTFLTTETLKSWHSVFWHSCSQPSAVCSSANCCAGSPKAKSTRSSVPQAFRQFPWRLASPTWKVSKRVRATICSCMQWVPTWRALSVPQLRQAS